jgi:Ca-activated chloride channel family protein
MIADFHFIRPMFLLLIPIGLLLSSLLWNKVSVSTKWFDVCDVHLIRHLLVGKQLKSTGLPYIGMALGWIIGSIALAGPAWERLPQPAHNVYDGRVIVFDLSLSMDSSDVQPSRLLRARYKLSDLILDGSDLQQGLVVFAGDAFVVAPLTDDTDTLINLTPSLSTSTVPVQGSRSDLGLELAASLISNTGLNEGEIILIADGVSAETEDVAARVSSRGFRVSVMAVGTSGGAPVQLGNGELLKDAQGNIVIPGVDHDALRRVAEAGGGRFVKMSVDNSDIEKITRTGGDTLEVELSQSMFEETGKEKFKSDQWKDNGPWLVLPLLLILALSFRRGWILTLAFLAIPLAPKPVHAFSWDDLWLRKDQQAARHFHGEQYDQIQDNAPVEWQGVAKYRSNDFIGAVDAFSTNDADNATAHYNRGNSMVRSGSLQASIAAYDRALEINPDMEDAIFNKNLVEELLKQQNEQASPQPNNDDSSDTSKGQKQDGKSGNADNRQPDRQNQQNADREISKNDTGQNSTGNKSPENAGSPDSEESNSDQSEPVGKVSQSQNQATGKQAENNGKEVEKLQIPMSEQQQVMEQWLQRIPDDPGGLLRRKFAHQYSQRSRQTHSEQW